MRFAFDDIADCLKRAGVWRGIIHDIPVGKIKIVVGSNSSQKKVRSHMRLIAPAGLYIEVVIDPKIIFRRKKFQYELQIHEVAL